MPHDTVIRIDGPIRGISLTPPLTRTVPAVVPPPPGAESNSAAPSLADSQERAAVERILESLARTAADLRNQQQEWLAEVRQATVTLSVAIASHLVQERLSSGDFAVEALVEKVIHRLEPRQSVTVYLHPEDLALLERRMGDRPLLVNGNDLRLTSDVALQRGSCRAESGDVSVLWQLEDQLRELSPRLLRCLEKDGAAG